MDDEIKIKKLIYRSSNRGCKETDLLLGKFASKHLGNLSKQDLEIYEQFIEENDWDIFHWINNIEAIPEKYKNSPVIVKLLEFNFCDV